MVTTQFINLIHFVTSVLELSEDELSIHEFRETWKEVIKYKLVIMCFMENPDPNGDPIIAGLNMTYPAVKGASYPNVRENSVEV